MYNYDHTKLTADVKKLVIYLNQSGITYLNLENFILNSYILNNFNFLRKEESNLYDSRCTKILKVYNRKIIPTVDLYCNNNNDRPPTRIDDKYLNKGNCVDAIKKQIYNDNCKVNSKKTPTQLILEAQIQQQSTIKNNGIRTSPQSGKDEIYFDPVNIYNPYQDLIIIKEVCIKQFLIKNIVFTITEFLLLHHHPKMKLKQL